MRNNLINGIPTGHMLIYVFTISSGHITYSLYLLHAPKLKLYF